MNSKKLRRTVLISVLGGVAAVLMLFNFPLPGIPAFLKFDFSEVPAILAVLTMGPLAGIGVELLKNILYWFLSGSPTGVPVGEIANFTTGVLFLLPFYYVFNKFRTTKGLSVSLVLGTVAMAVGMSILNYVVFIPMYMLFLGMPAMNGTEIYNMIILGILPFNILKGIILTTLTVLIFTRMKTWIEQQRRKLAIQ